MKTRCSLFRKSFTTTTLYNSPVSTLLPVFSNRAKEERIVQGFRSASDVGQTIKKSNVRCFFYELRSKSEAFYVAVIVWTYHYRGGQWLIVLQCARHGAQGAISAVQFSCEQPWPLPPPPARLPPIWEARGTGSSEAQVYRLARAPLYLYLQTGSRLSLSSTFARLHRDLDIYHSLETYTFWLFNFFVTMLQT